MSTFHGLSRDGFDFLLELGAHNNADLACRDGFHLHHTTPHPQAVGHAGFAQWCGGELARYQPLLAVLAP